MHHVRNFPFLDQAREKEFWQDKLQVVRFPRIPLVPGCCLMPVTVPRVLREQAHFLLRRPPRRDEASEAGTKMREAGRVDDGVGDIDGFGI